MAIVGAGPGGLTAAMILSRRGFEVDVFEAKDRVGGRNAEINLGPYRFDTGPTFLMMRHVLDEVFLEAGARSDEELEFVSLDPMYRLQFENLRFEPSSDQGRTRAEIGQVFPGREACFDRFIREEKRRMELLAPCLQVPYPTVFSLLSKNFLKALPRLSIGRSVHDVLMDYFGDEDMSLCFSFQTKYLGMSAWTCPGTFAMLAYMEHAFGIFHTMGGLSAISEAMARVAQSNGARIHLNAPVHKIAVENGAATGVVLKNGETVKADRVVINADFGHAMEHLIPDGVLRKWTPANLEKKNYSCSTFMLYLGIDRPIDLPHHTIFFPLDYRKYVEGVFGSEGLPEDLAFYVRNAAATDPSQAPEGHAALYVLVPVPNTRTAIDWDKETPAFRDRVLADMARRIGIPNLKDHIREEMIITPQGWRDDYQLYAGATFNLAHNLSQMLYMRPHNEFEEIACCYLVGGGTHPGSGLPTIYESGRIAANQISKREGVAYTSYNTQF